MHEPILVKRKPFPARFTTTGDTIVSCTGGRGHACAVDATEATAMPAGRVALRLPLPLRDCLNQLLLLVRL